MARVRTSRSATGAALAGTESAAKAVASAAKESVNCMSTVAKLGLVGRSEVHISWENRHFIPLNNVLYETDSRQHAWIRDIAELLVQNLTHFHCLWHTARPSIMRYDGVANPDGTKPLFLAG